MTNSMRNAFYIYGHGAVNATAIVRDLVQAVAEAREVAGTDCKHEAYAPARLMVAQLASLMGIGIGEVLDGDYELIKKQFEQVCVFCGSNTPDKHSACPSRDHGGCIMEREAV